MNKYLINPKMLDGLKSFFEEVCDIEEYEIPANDYGEVGESAKVWKTKLAEIDCDISDFNLQRTGHEVRRFDKTVVQHPYAIMLRGLYAVTEKDRVLANSKYYNIISVDYDSKDIMTRLICEIVEI